MKARLSSKTSRREDEKGRYPLPTGYFQDPQLLAELTFNHI